MKLFARRNLAVLSRSATSVPVQGSQFTMIQRPMRMFSDDSDSDFKPKSKIEGSSETKVTEHITNLID